ncbi:MAG: class I SAM-dependent methyltransferase [Clostridiaceae bacterium]|nr:class I SAM-dependent methyltransferase [Clostridiaceae bacterium]
MQETRELKLNPRLKIIADSIRGYESIADIGSDHAYLPIYLAKNERIKSAIATDINRGPVEISKERIKIHKVESKVTVRQGNGLEAIKQGETEVIVIAGMGGILIRDILDKDAMVAQSAKLLILQPMRDSDKIRRWLLMQSFDIIDEELVKDQDKIYEVIWAKPVSEKREAKGLMLVGDKIIEKKHPLAAEYINKKISELVKVLAGLEGMDTKNCRERTEECKTLLNFYREVLEWVQ